jgi:hypothetical protein
VDWPPEQDFTDNDQILILPARIQEKAVRGTEICLKADQLMLLAYCAHAQQTVQAGASAADGSTHVEYWLPIQLKPIAYEPLES